MRVGRWGRRVGRGLWCGLGKAFWRFGWRCLGVSKRKTRELWDCWVFVWVSVVMVCWVEGMRFFERWGWWVWVKVGSLMQVQLISRICRKRSDLLSTQVRALQIIDTVYGPSPLLSSYSNHSWFSLSSKFNQLWPLCSPSLYTRHSWLPWSLFFF